MADSTRAVIKTLEKNGYVEIIEEKIERNPFENKEVKRDKPYKLTDEQQKAFEKIEEKIENNENEEFLLYGITGSRKNRDLFAADTKGYRKRKKCNNACAWNIFNTSNDK